MNEEKTNLDPLLIYIPKDLKKDLKRKALDQDTSLKNIVILALSAYLD